MSVADRQPGATPGEALCHQPGHTPRWGMVIDVNRCVGCQTCTIACKHWNNTLPDIQWRRVIDIEEGEFPNVQRQFLVTGCQHCAEPPCVPVCPTGATRQRADGLVTMDYDVCIGCGYCAVSCPYQARTIAHEIEGYYEDTITQQEARVFDPGRLGVAQKCTFCIDRVDGGLAAGLTPGVDPQATPACSAACIAQAISFGDFNDPGSSVSRLTRDNPAFQMHQELGTDPQIKYLYTTPAVPGREAEARADEDERMSDPVNPLVGKLQTFWDWRAAMNWIFGGVSSGALFWLWIVSLAVDLPPAMQAGMNFGFGVVMAVGLFFVFLKIGRKLRFWRAISRPQTSWMTRELYVVAVFGLSVLCGLATQSRTVFAIVGLSALAFLGCQAMILWRARGIPAWRHPMVPWMIVATGLLEGAGLLALAFLVAGQTAAMPVVAPLGAAAAVAILLLWQAYCRSAGAHGIPPLSRQVLARTGRLLVPAGHLAPLALFVLGSVLDGGVATLAIAAASVLAIAGGAYGKFMVIARASYQQGFAMPMQPHRGSGTRAAPARMTGTDIRPANIRS
jgi:phenylacetyl-CoA:acceptor oxidoreductase subunit 1